jgi:hypothetical protein
MSSDSHSSSTSTVQIPATNGWPMVAAWGLTFIVTGLVTHWLVSALGSIIFVIGLVRWFHEVLPHEIHEEHGIEPEPEKIVAAVPEVMHLHVGEKGHRAMLPLHIYPYSAGIKGGLIAGTTTIVFAALHGLIAYKSIWYTPNLLAATGSMTFAKMSVDQLREFHLWGAVLATFIHFITCVMIGLLYGIALPMFPRRPILTGGILVPIFWTGILYSVLGVWDPVMQTRIPWLWFMVAQIIFGLVAGYVVSRHIPISTLQHVPFAMRAGFEAEMDDDEEEKKP